MTCRVQQLLEVGQNLARLTRRRPLHALAGLEIDRREDGHEQKIPAPYRHRQRLTATARCIGRACRQRNDFTLGAHRMPFAHVQAAATTSSWILKPASICAVHTVRAGGPLATYCR